MTAPRLPRALHPGAWWVWALALAAAATRTTNIAVLLLVMAVSGFVAAARRPDAPWGRSYAFFVKLALAVIVIRVGFAIVFGGAQAGSVLVRLPQVPLPSWLGGVTLGGPVTVTGLVGALTNGLQLAALLACVGAANTLASPARLLRHLPGALYEVGVAVTVAMTFAPHTVQAVSRVRDARRLRGRSVTGLAAFRHLAVPVLEEALDRSVALAAAMDARGFGRRTPSSVRRRRATTACTLAGLLAVCVGLYGLLDASSPRALGVPFLIAGCLLATAGLVLGGRQAGRSRYRPDPWRVAETLTALAGAAALALTLAAGHLEPATLNPGITVPYTVPGLPWLAVAGVLVALLPAWVSPPLPRPVAGPVASPVLERAA